MEEKIKQLIPFSLKEKQELRTLLHRYKVHKCEQQYNRGVNDCINCPVRCPVERTCKCSMVLDLLDNEIEEKLETEKGV